MKGFPILIQTPEHIAKIRRSVRKQRLLLRIRKKLDKEVMDMRK